MARPFLKLEEENESKLLTEIKSKKACLTALPPRATYEISWRCNYNGKKSSCSSPARGRGIDRVPRRPVSPDHALYRLRLAFPPLSRWDAPRSLHGLSRPLTTPVMKNIQTESATRARQ